MVLLYSGRELLIHDHRPYGISVNRLARPSDCVLSQLKKQGNNIGVDR